MDLELYRRLDNLIALNLGETAQQLSKKLEISPRQLKYMIETMRKEFECPIGYDRYHKRYYYKENGRCKLKFESSKSEFIVEAISTSLRKLLPSVLFIIASI